MSRILSDRIADTSSTPAHHTGQAGASDPALSIEALLAMKSNEPDPSPGRHEKSALPSQRQVTAITLLHETELISLFRNVTK